MLPWSLKTAILRTASSSLPRRSTNSATLTFSMAGLRPIAPAELRGKKKEKKARKESCGDSGVRQAASGELWGGSNWDLNYVRELPRLRCPISLLLKLEGDPDL